MVNDGDAVAGDVDVELDVLDAELAGSVEREHRVPEETAMRIEKEGKEEGRAYSAMKERDEDPKPRWPITLISGSED